VKNRQRQRLRRKIKGAQSLTDGLHAGLQGKGRRHLRGQPLHRNSVANRAGRVNALQFRTPKGELNPLGAQASYDLRPAAPAT
jgi:hypothetical protein